MGRLVAAIDPLLDTPPVDTAALGQGSLLQRLRSLQALQPLLRAGTFGIPLAMAVCLYPGSCLASAPPGAGGCVLVQPCRPQSCLSPQGWHWDGSCPAITRC